MSLWSNITSAIGNLFGGGQSEDEKRKKQAQAQAAQRQAQAARPAQNSAPGDMPSSTQAAVKMLNPVVFGAPEPLQKAQPTPAPKPVAPVAPKPVAGPPATNPGDVAASKLRKINPVLGPLADAAQITSRTVAPVISKSVDIANQAGNAIGRTNLAKAVDKSPVGPVTRFIDENFVKPVTGGAQRSANIASGKTAAPKTRSEMLKTAVDAGNVSTALIGGALPGTQAIVDWAGGKIGNTLLKKAVTRAIESGSEGLWQGGAISGLTSAGEGNKAPQVAQDTVKGGLLGGLLGGTIGGASTAIGAGLKKIFKGKKADDLVKIGGEADTAAVRAADEAAPGVKSTNPNREADALAAAEAKATQEAEQARVQQEADAANAPKEDTAPATTENTPIVDSPAAASSVVDQAINNPVDSHADDIRAILDDGKAEVDNFTASNPTATPEQVATFKQAVDSKVMDRVQSLQETRAAQAAPEARPVAPEPAPQVVQEQLPAIEPSRAVNEIAPSAAEGLPTAGEVSAPSPVEPPPALGEATVNVAPRTHDALVAELGPAEAKKKGILQGKYEQKLPLNIDDLKAEAAARIANMSDEELIKAFATTGPESMVTDARSFSLARATLDRLYKTVDDPVADQTVRNIMEGLERYASKGGEALRIVQEEFDSMPIAMKVRYLVKKLDKLNIDNPKWEPIAGDPALAAKIESDLAEHLNRTEALKQRVSELQGEIVAAQDAAQAGQAVNVDRAIAELKGAQRAVDASNGELVKYYTELVPKGSVGKRINNWARTMMLASPLSRVNDIVTTGFNVANLAAENLIQAPIAKVINTIRPGTVSEGSRGIRQYMQGLGEGLQKSKGEFSGTQYAGDLEKSLKSNVGERSGVPKTNGKIAGIVQAGTEFATNLTEGVKTQKAYQLAVKEAQAAGVPKEFIDQYAKSRAAVPSRAIADAAENLKLEMNNLNPNATTKWLNEIASKIDNKTAIGGFIKNQVMPFPTWLGGNIHNSITDKNVIASSVKTIASALKGDTEGFVRNLSKATKDAATTYALGYLLTQAGVITNQDAEGYNNAGAYLHLGDRYIPAGLLGFFAPSLILGNATYNGINNPEGSGSTWDKIATTGKEAVANMAKSINIGSALGGENNLTKAFTTATREGGDVADGMIQFGTGAVTQLIPAITTDINAFLNQTGLNPTGEKAGTKVTNLNPDTGRQKKDYLASAIASVENRIPLLSQTLPRKAGVAADDAFDRITKGNRDTAESAAAREDKQAVEAQSASNKANNIPDYTKDGFDEAVKARVENGEFDSAIEGLKQKLTANQANKDISKSKNKDIEDQIKQIQVTKDGGYDPEVVKLYKDTSLTEWRDMGDPTSDNYDQAKYDLLYQYDTDLAKSGVSRNNTKADKNFYSAKGSGKGGGKGRGGGSIKGGTIGDTPALAKISLGDLSPQKISAKQIPTIQQVKPGELIKKRQITVKKG